MNYFFDACAVQTVERSLVISPNDDNISDFLNELNQLLPPSCRLLEIDCLVSTHEVHSQFDDSPDHHIEFAINSYSKYIDCAFHEELESWFENYVVITKNTPPQKWNEPDFFRWVLRKKIGTHKLKCIFLLLPLSVTNGHLVVKYPEKVFHPITIGKLMFALSETNVSMRILFVLNKATSPQTMLTQGLRFAENVKYINLD